MLALTTYADPARFLERAQGMLEQHEALNNLILGLADTLIRMPDIYPEYELLTVDDGAAIRAVGLRTLPNKLQLYLPDVAQDVVDLVAQHAYEQDSTLPGVMAMVETAAAFADAWIRIAGGRVQSKMSMLVYELRQVTPSAQVAGELVPVTTQCPALLAEWVRAFYHESLHDALSGEQAEQILQRYLTRSGLYLWMVDGQPVAMAANNRQSRHGAVVGLVYTPPEQRGHGYASAVVAALSQQMLDSGKAFCALFTDRDYAVANRIYRKIGYRPLAEFTEMKFGSDP